jgi:nucleoside-diphosphate-sugar epimerase
MVPLVLVTGSAGRIGQAVVQEVRARGLPVRGCDRVPTPGLQDFTVGDLTDPEAVGRACAGAGTLIHLAATPDDADFLTELVPNNVIGVHHVLEGARAAGVKRLILASSGQVVWWRRMSGPWPIPVDAPPTPRSWYAACKVFLEAAGRAFAEGHHLSVIVARLGWCPRTPEHVKELGGTEWGPDVYLSPGDAGRFFACAVEAPADLRYAVVYACSKPVGRGQYDLEPAKRLVGFEPQDRWPQGIEAIVGPEGLKAFA